MILHLRQLLCQLLVLAAFVDHLLAEDLQLIVLGSDVISQLHDLFVQLHHGLLFLVDYTLEVKFLVSACIVLSVEVVDGSLQILD